MGLLAGAATKSFLSKEVFGITYGTILATGAATAASVIIGANQRRRLENANLGRIIDGIVLQDIDAPAEVHYGRTSAMARPVAVDTSQSSYDGGVPDNLISGTLGRQDVRKGAIFLVQYVLGYGDVTKVIDMTLDNHPLDETAGFHRIGWINNGVADSAASSFNSSLFGNSVFRGWSYITGIYKNDRKNPSFHAVPQIVATIEGKAIKPINADGTLGNASYSNNAVLVLLDYLLNDEYGPAGITEDDIDLASFRSAASIADDVVYGASSTSYQSRTLPDGFDELTGFTGSDYSSLYTSLGNVNLEDWGIRSRNANDNVDLKRYTFDGSLTTARTYPDVIARILSSMPGARLFAAHDTGKFKLSIPDTSLAKDAISVLDIHDDDILAPVTVTTPDSNRKLNAINVRFSDESNDWRMESETFPTPNSALSTSLVDQDNGAKLTMDINLPGVKNRYQARSIGANIIMQSRRSIYQVVIPIKHYVYEVGDVVHLDLDVQDIDVYVRIEGIEINLLDGYLTWTCIEYEPIDYAWIVDDAVSYGDLVGEDALALPVPVLVDPTVSGLDVGRPFVNVQSTSPTDEHSLTTGHEFRIRYQDGTIDYLIAELPDA